MLMLIATPHGPLALLGPVDEANKQEEHFKATLMSAEQGDAAAQHKLGVMYAKGRGVAQDYGKARIWYEKAADQDFAAAQFNLGVMHDLGEGVAQDYAKARVWYLKAAKQGDAKAQYNLGVMHHEGLGGARDYSKAHAWYLKAAEQGHARAKFALGVMCAEGRGGREACVQLLKCSVLSTAQGVRYATKLRDWVAAQMMVALFDEAKRLVTEWEWKAANAGHDGAASE